MRPRCKQRHNVWPTTVSRSPVNPKVLQVAPETPRTVGDRPLTEVAVGILQAHDQRVLLTTRPAGKAYAGYWEFPGGKLEAGETVLEALARELHEEINVQIDGGEVLQSNVVDYPHALVRLHFCLVRSWRGVITMREALNQALSEEMERDENVILLGEEVAEYNGAYKVSQGMLDEFGPDRVIDTPITEYGFAGIGTGAAMGGLRPVIEFMTFNFAMQAIDHIINSAAKTNYMSGGQMRCPIVFRGPNGAAARVGAQHSQNYAPWYASVPGLIVIAPYDAADAKGLLKAAIRCEDPVVFLENELLYGRTFEVPAGDDHVLPIGKARVVREGTDVTIVSYSIGVGLSLEAADKLAAEGISAEVIDLRTIRPLDTQTVLASLAKTNRLVVAEEGWPVCSVGSEILAVCMEQGFDDLDAPVLRVTNEDVPMPYAANLEKATLINADKIVAGVRKTLGL